MSEFMLLAVVIIALIMGFLVGSTIAALRQKTQFANTEYTMPRHP